MGNASVPGSGCRGAGYEATGTKPRCGSKLVTREGAICPTAEIPSGATKRSSPDTDLGADALGDDDERRVDVNRLQRIERLERELRTDVPRPQIDDAKDGLAHAYRERPEVGVVGQHDAPLRMRMAHDHEILRTTKRKLDDRRDVTTTRTQRGHYPRVNVLVRQQRMVEAAHAEILNDHTDSLRRLPAA